MAKGVYRQSSIDIHSRWIGRDRCHTRARVSCKFHEQKRKITGILIAHRGRTRALPSVTSLRRRRGTVRERDSTLGARDTHLCLQSALLGSF